MLCTVLCDTHPDTAADEQESLVAAPLRLGRCLGRCMDSGSSKLGPLHGLE